MTEFVSTPPEAFAEVPGFDHEPKSFGWRDLDISYVDVGEGPPVMLFHGEPTWSFLYRKVIAALISSGYRCIAADMPGFGRSDKPTDPAFYTYDTHTDAMVSLTEHLDLSDATAVVQDWGGPIGLRVATSTGRFNRLSILNTGLFTGGRVSEGFANWRAFVERTPDLPIGRIMLASAATAWPGEVLAAYEAPFPTPEHKVGAHRFPLIVPLTPDDVGATEMGRVMARLEEWTGPAQVLFSTQDPIFSLRVGERFVERIPGARTLEVVEDAGHFLQEDQGEEVGARIKAFLDSTG